MVASPLCANFSVTSTGASDEVSAEGQVLSVRRRLFLVLRAGPDVEIQLPSGKPLGSVDIHLALVSGVQKASELISGLSDDDLGFLLQVGSQDGQPFVHGAAAWMSGPLPYHLLQPGLRTNAQLTISSLPQLLDYDEPHVWLPGKAAMLRISAYTISCSNSGAESYDDDA